MFANCKGKRHLFWQMPFTITCVAPKSLGLSAPATNSMAQQCCTAQHITSHNTSCCLLRAANVKVIKTGTKDGCAYIVQQVKDEVRA